MNAEEAGWEGVGLVHMAYVGTSGGLLWAR